MRGLRASWRGSAAVLFIVIVAFAVPVVADNQSYWVQVTSQRSKSEELAVDNRQPLVYRYDLGSHDIYFRGGVGPFTSADEASDLCSDRKAAGGQRGIQIAQLAASPSSDAAAPVAPKVASDPQQNCKAIQDATARLACFDKSAKQPQPKPQKKAVAVDDFATAKAAMQRKLTDPMSAQWSDLFKVSTSGGEIICGKVNSKNRMGGYVGATGFIFEKSLNRATLMFSGGEDPDYQGASAAAYCVYCASDSRGDRKIMDFCPDLIRAYRR